MCVIAVETDRRSMDGLLGMTTSRLDAGDLPEMVGEFHIAVRDFNRAYNAGNPDARVESIGEFYVEPGAYAAEGVGGTNAMDDLTTTLGRTSLAVSRRERGAE